MIQTMAISHVHQTSILHIAFAVPATKDKITPFILKQVCCAASCAQEDVQSKTNVAYLVRERFVS